MTTSDTSSASPLVIGIVDDEPEDRALLRRAILRGMEGQRAAFLEAENAEGALRLAAGQADTPPPDVLLLDLNLPGLSGLDVLDRLRGEALPLPLPVVVVTGQAHDEAVTVALRLGAQDFVTKHELTPSTIMRIVRAAIERHRMLRQIQEGKNQLRASNESLRALNQTLGTRVAERTAELRASNHQLALQNRELQRFAYVTSHDLKEPLRKIQVFAGLLNTELAETEASEQGRHYAERMSHMAARMQSLVQSLLSYAGISSNEMEVEPVDLNLIAANVLEDLSARVEETSARVEVGVLPEMQGDPVLLYQLLLNLVGNGLKYHREGVPPYVRIFAREPIVNGAPALIIRANGAAFRPSSRFELVVEDDGIGFDEKYLSRIFDPFERLRTEEQYDGSGIGLAICRRVVERHSGTLTAHSDPGAGATFVALLPHQQQATQVAPAATQTPASDDPRTAGESSPPSGR